jgi:hypothetical protein
MVNKKASLQRRSAATYREAAAAGACSAPTPSTPPAPLAAAADRRLPRRAGPAPPRSTARREAAFSRHAARRWSSALASADMRVVCVASQPPTQRQDAHDAQAWLFSCICSLSANTARSMGRRGAAVATALRESTTSTAFRESVAEQCGQFAPQPTGMPLPALGAGAETRGGTAVSDAQAASPWPSPARAPPPAHKLALHALLEEMPAQRAQPPPPLCAKSALCACSLSACALDVPPPPSSMRNPPEAAPSPARAHAQEEQPDMTFNRRQAMLCAGYAQIAFRAPVCR